MVWAFEKVCMVLSCHASAIRVQSILVKEKAFVNMNAYICAQPNEFDVETV